MTIRQYFDELEKTLKKINPQEIENIIEILKKCKEARNSVFIIGNGGSASTSEHWANDLMKISGMKVFALTNPAIMTAYGNDDDYSEIFVKQLEKVLNPGDVVIGITGSGNSENIIKALKYCKTKDICAIGILGFDGGKAKEHCNQFVLVPTNDYGILEDAHLSIGHYLARRLK